MSEVFGPERRVSVSREISKLHEETFCDTFQEVIAHYTQNEPRGECVIVVAGAADEKKRENQSVSCRRNRRNRRKRFKHKLKKQLLKQENYEKK